MRQIVGMNNLTKEELQEILRCLKYMIKGGDTPYSCVTLDVKKKIQSIIDNCATEQQKRIDTACKEVFLENHKEFLDKTAFREIIKNDDIGK